MNYLAAIKKAEGPIPDLRPPKGAIAFDVPEGAIINGALIVAFAALIIGRLIHMRRPQPPVPVEPAIVLARRALGAAGGPTIVADCEQIARRYLFNAYGVGLEGATAAELAAQFATHPYASAETTRAIEAFLTDCDRARFAPEDAERLADTCISRATALIEELEQRRRTAEPAPLPVAT